MPEEPGDPDADLRPIRSPGELSRALRAARAGETEVRRFLLPSLRGYEHKWFAPDLFAAITLLVIAIPEQFATSRLAGMPPITGLYAFIAGTVLFASLGSSPQMSVGADSTIAPLFAAGLAHFAPTGSESYVNLAGILALCIGVIVGLVGMLRLGWIAEYFSASIITGFLAGVAIIIVVHQLPDFLGIASPSGSTLHRIAEIVSHLSDTNVWTLGIGLAVLLIVVGTERIDRKLPGALVGLVGSTAIVAAFALHSHGVAVLGSFSHGAPRFGFVGLSWSALRKVLPLAAVVSLVVVSQSAATTRAFAEQGGYQVDVGRDFLGVGAGSVVAGLIGSFPVDASPARTAAVASAGGRSQVAGLLAAGAMVLLIPAAGLLKDVPLATLAAVLMYIASRIFRTKDLRAIFHFDYVEFGLALVTLVTVALVGVEQGLLVAVGLAIVDRARHATLTHIHVLGRLGGTTSWVPVNLSKHAEQEPGVLVVLFASPVWYANAEHFAEEILGALRAQPDARALVLDTLGMSDVDYTASLLLGRILTDLERRHVTFGAARAGSRLRASLARCGLDARIGSDKFFDSVDEAVRALSPTDSGSA